jgi:hypothetical protein
MKTPKFTPEQEAEMEAYKRRTGIDHVFHTWINRRQDERRAAGEPWERSLYEWKTAMQERRRLVIWLRKARTGDLPTEHKQCSHSPSEPIPTNRLVCARGVDVTECPILRNLYDEFARRPNHYESTPDDADEVAADVCAWHIFTGTIGYEDRKGTHSHLDTSEGYVQHEGDRMFWSNVYQSLSMSDDEL